MGEGRIICLRCCTCEFAFGRPVCVSLCMCFNTLTRVKVLQPEQIMTGRLQHRALLLHPQSLSTVTGSSREPPHSGLSYLFKPSPIQSQLSPQKQGVAGISRSQWFHQWFPGTKKGFRLLWLIPCDARCIPVLLFPQDKDVLKIKDNFWDSKFENRAI